jgi:type VI secretion system protein VasD
MNGVLGAEDDSLLMTFLKPLRQNWAITPGWSPRNHNKETDVLRTNLTKTARWLLPLWRFSLTGCGVTQSVTDGTKSAFNAVFYKKIKILHLDFTAREALNTDSRENNSLSEPVVVRVYQLKDRKTFDKTVYQQLLQDDASILKDDMLASRDVVVKPGVMQALICRWKKRRSLSRWWGCSAIRI